MEGLVLTVIFHALLGVGIAGAGLWLRAQTPPRAIIDWMALAAGVAIWIGLYAPICRSAFAGRRHFRPVKDHPAGLMFFFLPFLEFLYAPAITSDLRGPHCLSTLGVAVWIFVSGAGFLMTGIPIIWNVWFGLLYGSVFAFVGSFLRLLVWWI
jgi:hypothetical protein